MAAGVTTPYLSAYVFPRPKSSFTAVSRARLRITQILRTPPDVKELSAPSIFYLSSRNAKTAKRFASAVPKRIGKGKFRARRDDRRARALERPLPLRELLPLLEGQRDGRPEGALPEPLEVLSATAR